MVTITGTLISDTLSVRAMLDSNDQASTSANDISFINNNRIHRVEFDLYQGSELDNVPPEIGNLTALDTLIFFICTFGELPQEIGNLINLKYLSVYSGVTTIPSEIGNLTNLLYLDLNANGFSLLPNEMGNLTNLTHLDLGGNNLTDLPSTIVNLTNIEVSINELEISQNKLPVGYLGRPWEGWADARDDDWRTTQQDPR